MALVALLLSVSAVEARAAGTSKTAASVSARKSPIPLLAYYYIWFNTTSWRRAKTDLPLLGPYSSDERTVMRRHVRWAKSAGIDGFVVSWKDTPTLDRRLENLIQIAGEEHFKLALIYEGLDFERRPLAAARVAADLDLFARKYASNPVFHLYPKPLVIWSGTWEFDRAQVAKVSRKVRSRVLLLASEKNVSGYERLADIVDGDAYYWSSVNPRRYPRYPQKLVDMGDAIRSHGGLWIAPAAVGFDARLIGGSSVVERRDGDTLREEMNGALASSPDAIGLISWNEFSENSHVEPSRKYGMKYLHVLASIRGTKVVPTVPDFNSDAVPSTGTSYGVQVIAGMAVVLSLLVAAFFLRRRPRRSRPHVEH
jgi:LPXTG-motif cell wall-anchored protein